MSSTTISSVPGLGQARSLLERIWLRIDRAMLRFQGRIDTPGYDQWLPYGFAVLQAAVLIALVLARYDQLDHGLETAKYTQATWQIGEDLKPVTTLSGGNILAEQASLILYPLGIVTSILPRTETLLVVKSLALAFTVIPLWRLARRHDPQAAAGGRAVGAGEVRGNLGTDRQLSIGATSTITVAFCIYTYVHNMNIADFAPAVLAVPALMWAVLAGFDEKLKVFIPAVLVVVFCRADLALAVSGLGVLLLIERKRRVGWIALLGGLGWFVVAAYGIQRGLDDGSYTFLEPYSAFGDTPLGVVWGILSNPLDFAKLVGTQDNFQILVTLLAPVLFLPLTAPRYLMPAVPLYTLYMGADVVPGRLREAAQTVPMTVFVFVATVFALKRTGRVLVKRVRVERRIILALLLTALVFFVRDSSTTPYTQPWEWGGRDQLDLARVQAASLIPEDEPVRASDSVLPLLSERLGVYRLDFSAGQSDGADPLVPVPLASRLDLVADAVTSDVDWLIIDREQEAIDPATFETFSVRLADRGWDLLLDVTGDRRIQIYQFTGVISSIPEPAGEAITFDVDE